MSKERPILFSGQMVRALLDGSKTQTRRPVKGFALELLKTDNFTPEYVALPENGNSPYGYAGDRLWVRETFQGPMWEEGTWDADTDYHSPKFCEYRADGGALPEYVDFEDNLHQGWKPSIHMPRWASRITLEVTGMRVERLQDISDRDCIAEGIGLNPSAEGIPMTAPEGETMPRAAYRALWDSLAARGADWQANPWVWVVEFKRI
jgi:hypothetical protein